MLLTQAQRKTNGRVTKLQVSAFLRERLHFYLKDVRGFAYDVVNAVLAAGADDVRDAIARAEAFSAARESADFAAISAAFKRIKNILRQAEEKGFAIQAGTSAPLAPEAQQLADAAAALAPEVATLRQQRAYSEALALIATLRPAVDAFFDKVMVLDPDPDRAWRASGADRRSAARLLRHRRFQRDCHGVSCQVLIGSGRSPRTFASFARLQSRQMADTLYLSLWYPNLRVAALPDKLTAVLGDFAAHGGEPRVYAATVWPMNWSESPVFQRVYGRGERGAEPRQAVEEALEILHDDYAYEFQIGWTLWEFEDPRRASIRAGCASRAWCESPALGRSLTKAPTSRTATSASTSARTRPFSKKISNWTRWPPGMSRKMCANWSSSRRPSRKASGATARLLWSELGESLAQRLAARLGKGN